MKIARLRPMPKTKKGPVRSFNRMATLLDVLDFALTKHIGAGGKAFFVQNGGRPVSQSSIKLWLSVENTKHLLLKNEYLLDLFIMGKLVKKLTHASWIRNLYLLSFCKATNHIPNIGRGSESWKRQFRSFLKWFAIINETTDWVCKLLELNCSI